MLSCLPFTGSASRPQVKETVFRSTRRLKIASQQLGAQRFEWRFGSNFKAYDDGTRFDAAEILPGQMWLGSVIAAMNEEGLNKHNIRFVLTVARNLVKFELPQVEDAGVILDHAVVEVDDLPEVDILSHFDEALDWIDFVLKQKKGAILIHCAQGISRSVSFALAYLMSRRQMSLKSATRYVEIRRTIANPNFGFRYQLLRYEEYDCDGKKARAAILNPKLGMRIL